MPFDVPFIQPSFPAAADFAADYEAIVESGWFSNFGPVERRFSAEIERYVGGGTRAVTVANATLGLLAAAAATFDEARAGSHVLVPSFTFAAGAQAIEWAGFRPVFVDIDPVTLQPSLDSAAEAFDAVDGDVAGIVFCNSFGIGDERIDDWVEASQRWEVPMIVDSAAGFGSEYADGTKLGARGACEVFSFHATKPFAVGEGGAVTSTDDALIERVAAFENFGFAGSRKSEYRGMNAKMSEFSAALGIRQFVGFDEALDSRRVVVARYADALQGSSGRIVPGIERSSVCFATILISDPEQLERTRVALRAGGVEFRDYYNPPVHTHPRFADYPAAALPHTDAVSGQLLSLPVHPHMSPDAIARVVSALEAGTGA